MRFWTRAVWLKAVGVTALAIAAGGGGAGCASERAPITRVQPNYMAKSFFLGDDFVGTEDDPSFYARVVVTDVGYGAAQDGLFTSTYAQNPTVIKWEVTEDFLLGRIIYERIDNADSHGDGPSSNDGQLAYAFPITSHFDIVRDYNPTTGEVSNVMVENTSDKPWNERKYMRIDWSRNLNVDAYDFDTLSLMGVYGGVSYEPLSYYVNEPNHPDAPHFATDEGYFDITTKAFATPGVIDLSSFGWGIDSFPACFLPNDFLGGSAPIGNCNPTELTLRMSFRRVEASDYEPVDWDGKRFTSFGIFTGERLGYARNYGVVDENWHRFADRYNIWEWSHAYQDLDGDSCPSGWVESQDFPGKCEHPCYTDETPAGQEGNRDCGSSFDACRDDSGAQVPNGTADECEDVGAGSQCDVFKQKCTLPYRERTPKPVVWHFTKGSNNAYYEGTEWATHEWDVAMRTSVRFAQYGECVAEEVAKSDLATAQSKCQADYPIYTGQQEENEDAIALARDVDDCRAARNGWADATDAGPWTEDRLSFCDGQADSLGAARGYSAGVISIAKMDEMITLCHGPVEPTDSPECIKDIQRLESDAAKAKDTRKVLPEGVTAAMCDQAWDTRYDDAADADEELLATCDSGFYARIGDLRYHQINVIRTAQTPSPWGIMVDADDPRTGEKIHASVNVWSHVTDLASQGHTDMMRYIKGEISTEEVTNGKYVRDWASAANASSGRGILGTMDKATVDRRRYGMFKSLPPRDQAGLDKTSRIPEGAELEEVVAQSKKIYQEKLSKVRADISGVSVNRPYTDARRLHAQNSPTEASLITLPMMQMAGLNRSEINAAQSDLGAGSLGSSPYLAAASTLRSLNPQIRRDLRQARQLALASRGACILDDDYIMSNTPNGLAAMADIMERKFGPWNAQTAAGRPDLDAQLDRAEKIRQYIAQRYQYAVIIHEMGHSIGERHNFVSSYFAMGYRPQYWQLRTNDGALTTKCNDVSADGENCVGPRYYDPPTSNEKNNLIEMFMQSSVMDYAGELTQDMIGLGAYDFAAARMFYGQTVAVHNDAATYGLDSNNAATILNVTDTFGGIVGYQYVNSAGDAIHYSELQKRLNLISNCQEVDPQAFKPRGWDDAKYGAWDPLLDGLIVQQSDGRYTRCDGIPVDYVPYNLLHEAPADNAYGFYGNGPAIDPLNRTRVPYGFATDSWADLGNLAVYRHDNGADPYELFNFLITEQETRHIFDNYRRQRTSFSIRTQAERILGRYNEKMRDGAKGLGLFVNIYRGFYSEIGLDFDAVFPAVASGLFPDNVLAAGIAFDHFTKQFTRPQSGGHFGLDNWQAPIGPNGLTAQDTVWRSVDGPLSADPSNPDFLIFDGATGYFGNVAYGGKLVENTLSDDNGEYDRDYTMNAGSYYDKVYAPYLLTESVDNFISDSLNDFEDPRYRSVSMADMFPDGYRRFLATMLTGDDSLKGPMLAANPVGVPGQRATPRLDAQGFPEQGIGFVSWWTPSPEACFPAEDRIVCSQYGCPDGSACVTNLNNLSQTVVALDPAAPANITPVDPQVNWEEWKWLVAQTLLYLPENAKTKWIDLMGIWELGGDTDPGFDNRIELHLPDGRIYIARTYGTEIIFGKQVQKGVGARILEYANDLLRNAYVCTEQLSPAGDTSWCVPDLTNGQPVVKFDPALSSLGETSCSAGDFSECTCTSNRACMALQNYQSLPAFIRQAMHDFRMADASMKGIYD
ncbi:MAG: hypothetical protein U0271_33815 [Polyangiaceae bacterium]